VIKPGGKVFVDLEAFSAWLEERRGAPSVRIVGKHRAAIHRRRKTGLRIRSAWFSKRGGEGWIVPGGLSRQRLVALGDAVAEEHREDSHTD
jgi:hypothetical protein